MDNDSEKKYAPVLFISKKFEHHSKVSGYEQLALRWPGPKEIIALSEPKNINSKSQIASWIYLAKGSFNRYAEAVNVKRLAKAKGFSIVHALYAESDLPFPAMPPNIKLVATFHQPMSHLSRSENRIKLLRKQLENVDLCVTVSSAEANFIASICSHSHTVYIPHGIDTEFFALQKLPRNRTVFIMDGWYRDGHLARGVVEELLRIDSSCEVRVAGLRHPELKIAHPRVHILPRLSDEQLREEYSRCALLFLPLKEATANNSLLEALSCGTRIVAPKLSGVTDYLGEIATYYDPSSQHVKIAKLIQLSLDTSEEIAPLESNRRSVAEKYDWNRVMVQMNELYADI